MAWPASPGQWTRHRQVKPRSASQAKRLKPLERAKVKLSHCSICSAETASVECFHRSTFQRNRGVKLNH